MFELSGRSPAASPLKRKQMKPHSLLLVCAISGFKLPKIRRPESDFIKCVEFDMNYPYYSQSHFSIILLSVSFYVYYCYCFLVYYFLKYMPAPVSYTHLDVYKRQSHYRVTERTRFNHCSIRYVPRPVRPFVNMTIAYLCLLLSHIVRGSCNNEY